MIPYAWRSGEIAVIGLSRTGFAVARFLSENGYRVYASDASESAPIESAADSLRALGVAVDVGRHDLSRIERAVLVVPSPGVPPTAPPLEAALDAGCTVIAELDLALLFMHDIPAIVVTGTNGKSTTTALVAHLLRESGLSAIAAGNIGYPLIQVAAAESPPDWIVAEASSYQLHFAPNLEPRIGMLTNVSPEHLDWHGTAEAYYADKGKLFSNSSADSVWVLNGDDAIVLELAATAAGEQRIWSMCRTADAWYDSGASCLIMDGKPLVSRARFHLLGEHNVSNGLAAALAASAAGVDRDSIERGLSSFQPLGHRLEPIREVDAVLWINDSKATNIASTEVAVAAMTRPFVLVLGGRGKGEAYSRLCSVVERGCHDVVAYGEERERIARELGTTVPVHPEECFDEAVLLAGRLANTGDVVLLSPACASFDQFSDFEERGKVFREIVEAL